MNHEDCEKCKDRRDCEGEEGDPLLRGCRLKHAFPDCYTKKDGILCFDLKKVLKKIRAEKRG